MAEQSRIIILNGVGSVGKTSTARALQHIAAAPMLHVSMDVFITMLPEKMFGHPDGLIFETEEADGKKLVRTRSGKVMARTMKGMRHAIAALAAQGNHIIVDDVMIGSAETQDYKALLAPFFLRMVGLFAPLEVLEAREKARGDRQIGLARWQYDRVHLGQTYDLTIDTTATTPLENAQRIRDAFAL